MHMVIEKKLKSLNAILNKNVTQTKTAVISCGESNQSVGHTGRPRERHVWTTL